MRICKKFTALLLALLMVLQLMPTGALAEMSGWQSVKSAPITAGDYYTVTFSDVGVTQFVAAGEKPVLPEAPTKESENKTESDKTWKVAYTFDYWSDGKNGKLSENDDYQVTDNTTFTAVYREEKVFTVTVKYVYNDNSESKKAADDKVYSYRESELKTAAAIESPKNVVKTINDEEVQLFPEQESVSVADVACDTTFTVKYAPADTKYTVRHMLKDLEAASIPKLNARGSLPATSVPL